MAFIIPQTTFGRLKLMGRDRMALIHRMSTNDLNQLKQGQAMLTVLTSPIGRIIDLLRVLHAGDETLVITGAGRGEQIRAYLQRNIFFNDQVSVVDVSAETQLLTLYGADLPSDALLQGCYFLRFEDEIWLCGTESEMAALETRLLADGVQQASAADYDIWRIQKGLPSQAELTEDYIPLETGLWHAVSFSKGCYTGQEIIARMESRGKLAKMLVCLSSTGPLGLGEEVWAEGAKVGSVTSVAEQNGQWLGLGYIKSAVLMAGIPLQTSEGLAVRVEKIAGTQRE